MLTFLAGDVISSLYHAGVNWGWNTVSSPSAQHPPYGIHFVDIIARVAMMFGGVTPGDSHRLLTYAAERAKAMVIVFPGLSDQEIALVRRDESALAFPLLSVGGYAGGDWIPALPEAVVRRGMEIKGIRVNITAIPIPMGCSPAFLRERVSGKRRCMWSLAGEGLLLSNYCVRFLRLMSKTVR